MLKKIITAISLFLFCLVFSQPNPKAIIKSERKIYSALQKNGEWKRGKIGCYDEYNEYNEKGQLLKYFDILYDEETKNDSLKLKQINDYLNGKIASEEHYFGQKYKFEEKKWKYDSLGRTVSLVSKEFYSSGNEKSTSKGTRTTYPSSNVSVEISGSYHSSKIPPEEYKMNPLGRNIIPKSRVYMEIEEDKTVNDFDASGNLIKSTYSSLFNNSLWRIGIYKYDKKSRVIYRKEKGLNPIQVKYHYNKKGLLKKEIFTNSTGTETTDYQYLKYDQFGNWTEMIKSERHTYNKTEPDDFPMIRVPKNAGRKWCIQRKLEYY